MARLGKGWCLNVPPTKAQAATQDNLIVWGGAGGGQGCDPSIGDVSNQWFTFNEGHIVADQTARDSELLAGCRPDCCIAAEPCLPPACHWSKPTSGIAWGGTLLLVLGIGGALYVAGGVFLNRPRAGVARLALHPHSGLWRSLGDMVADGVAFSRASVNAWRAGGEGYSTIATAGEASEEGAADAAAVGAKAEEAAAAARGGEGSDSPEAVAAQGYAGAPAPHK